jgi:outer membrane protein assembly factor BamB
MTDDFLDEKPPEPVRNSRWRVVALIAVCFGAALFVAGKIGASDDEGKVSAQFVMMSVMFAPPLAVLGFAFWWTIFGDFRWWVRLLCEFGCVLAFAGAIVAADPSIRPFFGMMGIPLSVGITALALVATPGLTARRFVGPLVWLLAVAPWQLLRMEGVDGRFDMVVSYRWKQTAGEMANENLAGRATTTPTGAKGAEVVETVTDGDWPGFRGAGRTGIASLVASKGWEGKQPQERWRHSAGKVGQAWSSICVVGNSMFTQEQRGDAESVVCYRADTGEEVWARGEPSQHNDWASGTGPRATPTYAKGMVYAASATGTISCLRAANGAPVWNVSLPEQFQTTKPQFGFSSSPLVLGDLVFVNTSSKSSPRLVALDAATGKTRWATEARGTDSYSSPHPATIHGVEQVLLFNGDGLFGYDPATGRELWHYDWVVAVNEPTTVQPLVLPEGRVIIGGGNINMGSRCVEVKKQGDTWTASEVWRTTKFTPKFNDVVRSGDYLYGLENGMLCCVKLSNGERVWREGRYGSGQVLLVGDKLLILTEMTGQLVCVAAKPDEYEELWKMDVLKGKTWNHPAVARGKLFVRNSGEMAVYDLPGVKENPSAGSAKQ